MIITVMSLYRIENSIAKISQGSQVQPPQNAVEDTTVNLQQVGGTSAAGTIPPTGWQSGKSAILERGFKITRSFIYDYLVQRSVNSGPANNFRALKTGYNLFASGHVQSVQMATSNGYVFYKSSIFPSMKKDKAYTTSFSIDVARKKLVRASCSCPVGTSESCVHVSALLHALECLFESSKNAVLVASAVGESRTSRQCTWLKPRARKIHATSATNLQYVKHEYGKKKRKTPPPPDFDPRPPSKRSSSTVNEARQLLYKGIKGSGICAELLLESN